MADHRTRWEKSKEYKQIPSERLLRAYREYAHEHNLPLFLDETAKALGRPKETISVFPWEAGDALWAKFLTRFSLQHDRVEMTYGRTWTADQREGVEEFISRLRARLPEHPLVLFREETGDVAWTVETTSAECLDKLFNLVSLNQDDLRAMSEDASEGITFEHHSYGGDTGYEEVYELWLWGERWLKAAEEAT